MDSQDRKLLKTLYHRQHVVLHLASAHAEVLACRPFLLHDFATLARQTATQGSLHTRISSLIETCLEAACKIVRIVRELCEEQRLLPALWFTHYYAFCAVVVLYVYIIQQHQNHKERCRKYLSLAEQCQLDLETAAQPDSFAQRCGVVLSELQTEAFRRVGGHETGKGHSVDAGSADWCDHRLDRPNIDGALPERGNEDRGLDQSMLPAMTPDSFVANWAGWEDFDSLVTGGTGGGFDDFYPLVFEHG